MSSNKRLRALLATLAAAALLVVPPAMAQPSSDEVESYLTEIIELTEEALSASRTAEEAATVEEVKAAADVVFEAVWGLSSELPHAEEEVRGGEQLHGWKVRWQTSPAEYDEAYSERLGTEPPEIDDPRELGIVGRGRYLRHQFAVESEAPTEPGFHYEHEAVIAPLNNVIGWTRMGSGITKGELQPRVDLTYQWDAPVEFWNSTADTGWIHEAYAQALNILKTDYQGDVEMAREHAGAMSTLLERSLEGTDASGNGQVEPVMMEGGLRLALEEARAAGLASR